MNQEFNSLQSLMNSQGGLSFYELKDLASKYTGPGLIVNHGGYGLINDRELAIDLCNLLGLRLLYITEACSVKNPMYNFKCSTDKDEGEAIGFLFCISENKGFCHYNNLINVVRI